MSNSYTKATQSLPEFFYDLISIFLPGFYMSAALAIFLGDVGITDIEYSSVVSPTIDSLIFMYFIGHVVYSLSSFFVAKFFNFFTGNPRRFLLVGPREERHVRNHKILFLGPPYSKDFLAREVEKCLRSITGDEIFSVESENVNMVYELCRNFVMENATRRSSSLRKEQSYGEMARGFVLISLVFIIAYISSFFLGYYVNIYYSVAAVSCHLIFFLSSVYRYGQARLIDPLFVYTTFQLLAHSQEPQSAPSELDALAQPTRSIIDSNPQQDSPSTAMSAPSQFEKIVFQLDHGTVEGIYLPSDKEHSPLVVITNGHNGFYMYGMFPHIQDVLQENSISSYSYNFSHGGVEGDNDHFTDLESYKKNCMRLEMQDLTGVVNNMTDTKLSRDNNGLFLLSHSLGAIPTLFGAKEIIENGVDVDGIILMSPIKTLDVFPDSMMEEWEKDGVYYMENKRTEQELPQGPEFLNEVKNADSEWNVEDVVKELDTDFLIVHGEDDDEVPPEHGEEICTWAEEGGSNAETVLIENAGHTFNTDHPSKRQSEEIDNALARITSWIHNNL